MPQIYDMRPTALLPPRRKTCWGFFRPKNPTASAGFEPANLGTKGQHATPRPPKPWCYIICSKNCDTFLTKEWDNLINLAINDFIEHQPNYPIVPFMLCLDSISGHTERHVNWHWERLQDYRTLPALHKCRRSCRSNTAFKGLRTWYCQIVTLLFREVTSYVIKRRKWAIKVYNEGT